MSRQKYSTFNPDISPIVKMTDKIIDPIAMSLLIKLETESNSVIHENIKDNSME